MSQDVPRIVGHFVFQLDDVYVPFVTTFALLSQISNRDIRGRFHMLLTGHQKHKRARPCQSYVSKFLPIFMLSTLWPVSYHVPTNMLENLSKAVVHVVIY